MNKLKKIFFIIAILAPLKSYGLVFDIVPNSNTQAQGSQFYVDVLVDTQGTAVNGLSGDLLITKNAKIVRIEDGGSVVKNWVSRPLPGNAINFSGIIPNGFNGYLNATSQDKKGLVFRVVLESKDGTKNNQKIDLQLNNLIATKNDGEGTIINAKNQNISIDVSSSGSSTSYELNDNEKPEVSYEIVSDENLFDGKKVLVFSVVDSKSGFKNAYVKEGMNDFVPATSPYLLEDQSLKGIILIKVIDNAGNESLVTIRPSLVSYLNFGILGMALIFVAIIVVFALYIKNRKNKK